MSNLGSVYSMVLKFNNLQFSEQSLELEEVGISLQEQKNSHQLGKIMLAIKNEVIHSAQVFTPTHLLPYYVKWPSAYP